MANRLKLILNLLLLFCLVACSRNTNISPLLKEAEGYMNERPDSALLLLDSITHREDMSKEQNALWCLLYTQAQDKNRIEHTSDSLIQIAVNYYEKTDREDRKMLAYYYCGNVFYDLNDALQAQDYYLKAYKVGKNLDEPYWLGRLCANLGTLYIYQELYQPALDFQKEAAGYFLQDEDTVSLSMALRNIARIYVCENQLNSAITYYSKALPYTSGSHALYISNELADAYGRVGEYGKGVFYARQASALTQTTDDSCLVSLTLGDLFLKQRIIDSAYHYLSFCRRSTNVYTLKDTYHSLSQLEKYRGNLQTCLFFLEQYETLRDSVEKQPYKESLSRLQNMYDYQHVEKEKESYRQEADRKTNYLYRFLGITFFFLLLVVCIVFYLFKEKKKKEEQLNQSLRLQEQKYRDSQQYLAERNATIAELSRKAEVADDLKMQLDMMLEVVNKKIAGDTSGSIGCTQTFFTSDIYEGICKEWKKLDCEQWLEIVKWIDHVLYPNFTYKIKMVYPSISEVELQVCCLTKLDIPVSRIAVLLSMTSQAVSLNRKRLYKKLTQQEGTAKDFDKCISSL